VIILVGEDEDVVDEEGRGLVGVTKKSKVDCFLDGLLFLPLFFFGGEGLII